MEKLAAWLRSQSAAAHAIAGFAGFVMLLIAGNADVRNQILDIFNNYPRIGSAVVLAAVCFAGYMNSLSPAGIAAKARAISNVSKPIITKNEEKK